MSIGMKMTARFLRDRVMREYAVYPTTDRGIIRLAILLGEILNFLDDYIGDASRDDS